MILKEYLCFRRAFVQLIHTLHSLVRERCRLC